MTPLCRHGRAPWGRGGRSSPVGARGCHRQPHSGEDGRRPASPVHRGGLFVSGPGVERRSTARPPSGSAAVDCGGGTREDGGCRRRQTASTSARSGAPGPVCPRGRGGGQGYRGLGPSRGGRGWATVGTQDLTTTPALWPLLRPRAPPPTGRETLLGWGTWKRIAILAQVRGLGRAERVQGPARGGTGKDGAGDGARRGGEGRGGEAGAGAGKGQGREAVAGVGKGRVGKGRAGDGAGQHRRRRDPKEVGVVQGVHQGRRHRRRREGLAESVSSVLPLVRAEWPLLGQWTRRVGRRPCRQ